MPRWLRAVGRWLDARLALRASLRPLLAHPVPKSLLGPKGWWYVFGSASLTLLLIQILTGIGPMAGRVPWAGPSLVELLFGGPVIGGSALSRFFALHVFIIPGLLLFFLAVHLWLVVKRGISAPPVPGAKVDPKTYDAEYEE